MNRLIKHINSFVLIISSIFFINLAKANTWEDFNNYLKNNKTFTANFNQVSENNNVSVSGKLYVKVPNNFRWEVNSEKNDKPIQIITVENKGEYSLAKIYDLDLRQVIIKKLMINQTITPAEILLGKVVLEKSFDLQAPEKNSPNDKGWLIATAKADNPNNEIKLLKINFNNNTLSAIKFVDALDRSILINFSSIVINKNIDNDIFKLNLPSNIDIIDDSQ